MDKHESVDLDALDQLHAAATKGEWRVSITSNEDSCLGRYVFQVVEYPYKGNHEIFAANPYNRSEEELVADVELIAALHNAYPAMAAELRALREERDRLWEDYRRLEQVRHDLIRRCERMKSLEGMPLDEIAARQLEREDALRAEAAELKAKLDEVGMTLCCVNDYEQFDPVQLVKDYLETSQSELATLRAEAARLREAQNENDQLRSLLATSSADCAYCGLPAKQMAKCASGFPGCARADDMLCSATPTRDDLLQELAAARAEAARLRAWKGK